VGQAALGLPPVGLLRVLLRRLVVALRWPLVGRLRARRVLRQVQHLTLRYLEWAA